MKKVLAAILALAMLLAMFSAVSFASEYDVFIDFATEEGQACGEFFGNGDGTRYEEDMGAPVKVRLENHADAGGDATADNGGIYNNGIRVKFNAPEDGIAHLTLKLSAPDAHAVQNNLGLALGYSVNGGEFKAYVLGDDDMQDSFTKELDIDVVSGENTVSFLQLNGQGTSGNGWRIDIWNIGIVFDTKAEDNSEAPALELVIGGKKYTIAPNGTSGCTASTVDGKLVVVTDPGAADPWISFPLDNIDTNVFTKIVVKYSVDPQMHGNNIYLQDTEKNKGYSGTAGTWAAPNMDGAEERTIDIAAEFPTMAGTVLTGIRFPAAVAGGTLVFESITFVSDNPPVDETNSDTGDATMTMFAAVLVLALGAAVVFAKKKAF